LRPSKTQEAFSLRVAGGSVAKAGGSDIDEVGAVVTSSAAATHNCGVSHETTGRRLAKRIAKVAGHGRFQSTLSGSWRRANRVQAA